MQYSLHHGGRNQGILRKGNEYPHHRESGTDILSDFEATKETVFDTAALSYERTELQAELNLVAELIERCIDENAHLAQDQTEYQKRYNSLARRLDRTKGRLGKVKQAIAEKQAHREMVEQFIKELSKHDAVTEFSDKL